METRSRRRSKSKTKRIFRKIKPLWLIKGILYALGLFSFFYSTRQYSVTLITDTTLLIVGLVSGILASLIIERNIKYYLFSIILLGSLCLAVFFRLNRQFVFKTEEHLKQRILYKAEALPGTSGASMVTISYEGNNKDINIPGDRSFLIGRSSFVILTVRRGGLGFYIITNTELVK